MHRTTALILTVLLLPLSSVQPLSRTHTHAGMAVAVMGMVASAGVLGKQLYTRMRYHRAIRKLSPQHRLLARAVVVMPPVTVPVVTGALSTVAAASFVLADHLLTPLPGSSKTRKKRRKRQNPDQVSPVIDRHNQHDPSSSVKESPLFLGDDVRRAAIPPLMLKGPSNEDAESKDGEDFDPMLTPAQEAAENQKRERCEMWNEDLAMRFLMLQKQLNRLSQPPPDYAPPPESPDHAPQTRLSPPVQTRTVEYCLLHEECLLTLMCSPDDGAGSPDLVLSCWQCDLDHDALSPLPSPPEAMVVPLPLRPLPRPRVVRYGKAIKDWKSIDRMVKSGRIVTGTSLQIAPKNGREPAMRVPVEGISYTVRSTSNPHDMPRRKEVSVAEYKVHLEGGDMPRSPLQQDCRKTNQYVDDFALRVRFPGETTSRNIELMHYTIQVARRRTVHSRRKTWDMESPVRYASSPQHKAAARQTSPNPKSKKKRRKK